MVLCRNALSESRQGWRGSLAAPASIVLVWLLILGAPAVAQRVQFPSPVQTNLAQGQPPSTFAPSGSSYPPGTVISPGSNGALSSPTYGAQPGVTPSVVGPPASFNGTVTPPPVWDPYSAPGPASPGVQPYYQQPAAPAYPTQPGALFPNGVPSLLAPSNYAYSRPDGTVGQYPRLFRQVRFEHTWVAGDGKIRDLEFHTSEITGTLQFPFFYNPAPLLVTPGFAVHTVEAPGIAFPSRLYDAYVDTSWQPVLTPWLSADLGVRVGVYSDFNHTTTDSIRLMGRGLGILTFTPQVQVALGVVYLDRVDIKLLPAGGVIWTPHENARYEILFPRPKLARRLTTIGTTEWWWYAAGEYGGGSWTLERDAVVPVNDRADYNDLRVMGGVEFSTLSGLQGHFEVGYVFDREVVSQNFATDPAKFRDTFMLRGGITY